MGLNRIEKKIAEIIIQNFKDKNIKILELCPGDGNLTEFLYDSGYKNYETADIYPENFKFKKVKCLFADLNKDFSFQDKTYDLVICCEGIEHLEKQYKFAAECNRIIKDDGYFLMTTPNIVNFASRIKFLFSGFFSLATRPSSEFKKNWVIEHIYPLTFWQLRHILHTSGFEIKIVSTDHIRRSSLIGLLFWPFSFMSNYFEFKKEMDLKQREVNMIINRQMHNLSIYLGRTQIVLTKKEDTGYVK